MYSTASTTVSNSVAYWGGQTPSFYVGGGPYQQSSPALDLTPYLNLNRESFMKITAKSHLVIARASGAVVEVHDSKEEALAAAKRLAAKEMDDFTVFSPAATVRPKPVDVEVVEA